MSQSRIEELKEKSRAALTGSIGRVRAAALVAALVPLASVAVAPAVAEAQGTGGYVVPSPCDLVTSGGLRCATTAQSDPVRMAAARTASSRAVLR
jgi:hypothetical protein